ncbi:hypothetical protein ACFL1X_02755, partial [Candidatus Hydrogenedentota bacterium]
VVSVGSSLRRRVRRILDSGRTLSVHVGPRIGVTVFVLGLLTTIGVGLVSAREGVSGKAPEAAPQEKVHTRGRITGTVSHANTGMPVSGAYVGIGDFGDSGGSNRERHEKERIFRKAETDENGRFMLDDVAFVDDLPYQEQHPLVVTHPDFVRYDGKIVLVRSAPEANVEVSLRPAGSINVAVVDGAGQPVKGVTKKEDGGLEGFAYAIRLEALDGHRFIPPGKNRDRHLSAFASSAWNARLTNGTFAFTELDKGAYSLEVIEFEPFKAGQVLGVSAVKYHGSIPNMEIEGGDQQEMEVAPTDYGTRLTIELPDIHIVRVGTDEIGPDHLAMKPFMYLSRNTGLLLWDDGEVFYSLEDPRLGRIVHSALFHARLPEEDSFTIENLPPGSYSIFAGPVVCMRGAAVEVVAGQETTVHIPEIPEKPGVTPWRWELRTVVELEAKEYTVKDLCGIFTEARNKKPVFEPDVSISSDRVFLREGHYEMWDVLEALFLEKGWRVRMEGKDKVMIGGGDDPPATTIDELGAQFVAAVAMGDMAGLDRMYITPEEFKATFSGNDLDTLYASLQKAFHASLEKALPELQGAQFLRMNMKFCPEPISARPGTDFGSAVFKIKTLATDNIRAVVNVDGEEREIKLDSLVKVGDSWRLLSPDVELLAFR